MSVLPSVSESKFRGGTVFVVGVENFKYFRLGVLIVRGVYFVDTLVDLLENFFW